jgi:hypothetical protein
MKESSQVEAIVKKYLYKSHGKFSLAMIDIDANGPITGKSVPVSSFSRTHHVYILGIKSTIPLSDVPFSNNPGVARHPN